MTRRSFFKVFDAKVLPILLYSSEIWGHQILDTIERVHMLACKRFLGVPICTPNKLIYGELGRYPLFINSYVRCLKYWFRLLHLNENRLPNQAYRMLLNMDENGKDCLATRIRYILSSTGFYYVWLFQGVGNENVFLRSFKQRLADMFTQDWCAAINDKE